MPLLTIRAAEYTPSTFPPACPTGSGLVREPAGGPCDQTPPDGRVEDFALLAADKNIQSLIFWFGGSPATTVRLPLRSIELPRCQPLLGAPCRKGLATATEAMTVRRGLLQRVSRSLSTQADGV